MKKMLSFLLAIMLICSISIVPAFAIDTNGLVADKTGNCSTTVKYTYNGQQKSISGTGTWYLVPDGSRSFMIETADCYVWLKNVTVTIDGIQYLFDSNGRTVKKATVDTSENKTNGFVTIDTDTFYYINGRIATGARVINNTSYYFSTGDDGRIEGAMLKNAWQKQCDYWYRYDADGKLIKDKMFSVGEETFKVDSSGRRQTGIITVNGDKYFFAYGNDGHTEGAMVVNSLRKINGAKYYFGTDGKAAKNTWVSVNGSWYYAGSDCRLS